MDHYIDRMYFQNISYEKRKENRQKVLATSADTLGKYVPVLQKAMQEWSVCVVGHEETCRKLEKEGFVRLETIQ